ncbi:DNA gyrase C-terminal beta-propeller domain-containing protein [Roseofilum capinflatum]|uniref:DNA gyrase C-terminal beta-propeller domain-containing protein n=1 Tax=Roseofilum capinflatum BLCC-M114 TaxID=3022440 RepID=A0ABT7B7A5_9CYAN|nr:DNA gyrase C-terminal beta-propeller domain-containing protein [Roseofilum capinflatum BLCC-M114]
MLATSGGRILRLDLNSEQVPVLGRTAQGYQALRLRKQEQLVGCVVARPQDQILLVSESCLSYRLRKPSNQFTCWRGRDRSRSSLEGEIDKLLTRLGRKKAGL